MSKIYFFNGWGMDKNLLKPVKNSTEYNIEVIDFPYNIDKNSIDKDDIFIGYSFGVYYLNKFLSENRDLKYKNLSELMDFQKPLESLELMKRCLI